MTEAATRQAAEPQRAERPELFGFITDAETIGVLRDGLGERAPRDFELRRANVDEAIAALRKMPTPRTMIIDISGQDQPLSALDRLSEVVEPDVRVLLIGDQDDASFYRQVTRGMGVLEYLHKPLRKDMVARYFGPLITGKSVPQPVHGGRIVSITGVRGGVGASTVAVNLAWYFGVEASRHTLLVDGDLHRGTCAMLLGVPVGNGMRAAMENPQRVDQLFVERTAQVVRERLHLLAAEENLADRPGYAEGAAARLMLELQRRYNFVIIDLPFSGAAMHRDMMMEAHHRILVLEPTLAGVRDTLRFMALPNGAVQPSRPLIVLNRAQRRGCLTSRQIEDALSAKVDVVIPDAPVPVGNAATLGEAALRSSGPFRKAMLQLASEISQLRTGRGDLELPDRQKTGWRMASLRARPRSLASYTSPAGG